MQLKKHIPVDAGWRIFPGWKAPLALHVLRDGGVIEKHRTDLFRVPDGFIGNDLLNGLYAIGQVG